MWTYKDNELYHYGVLGMKWGVRKSPESSGRSRITKRSASYGKKGIKWNNKYYNNGKFTKEGRRKFKTVKRYNANYKWNLIGKVALAAFAVGSVTYLASPYGRELALLGKTYFSTTMKKGTLVQNISQAGRDFGPSFYGSRDLQTRQFFLKNFTQFDKRKIINGVNMTPTIHAPRDTAYLFKNSKKIKIAGRLQMDKALKAAAKAQGFDDGSFHFANTIKDATGRIVNGESYVMPVKTFRDRTKVWRRYGAMDENYRELINSRLSAKGFGGFKDVNDIMINWGSTPTVFFGKKSGLSMVKSSKVNVDKAHQINVKLKLGHERVRDIMYGVGKTTMYSAGMGALVATSAELDNNAAFNLYNKPYKDLTRSQKKMVSKYHNSLTSERKQMEMDIKRKRKK